MEQVNSIASSDERNHCDDEEEQSKSPNPSLYQRCQRWDDIWTSCRPQSKSPISLQELSRKSDCLMCRFLRTMIETRRGNSETLRKWPASSVLVVEKGPFFLDNGVWPPKSPFRIDSSDLTRTAIRLLWSLELIFLSDALESDETLAERESEYGNRKVASKIALTPQLCFNYSAHDTPHLISIEPWETPMFDISLLKTWLQGCEAVHGSLCVGKGQVQISEHHRPSGRQVLFQ